MRKLSVISIWSGYSMCSRLGQTKVTKRRSANTISIRSVGLDRTVRLGDRLETGDSICRVHAANEAAAEHVKDIITQAVVIDEKPMDISPIVIERIA